MRSVTLHARVWIEIPSFRLYNPKKVSPSTRGCGLKSVIAFWATYTNFVTLHARVWIEMYLSLSTWIVTLVTLHARVWIEIPC